ncbi:MAG: hypothetical protein KAJ95_02775, partial [Gammaproteobacteria bacterium]|nr:hypothetical protein [Gammaproteobacteria bacterium]
MFVSYNEYITSKNYKGHVFMIDVMINKNGEQTDIEPYKWIYTEDGLPATPVGSDKPNLFYIRLE